MISNHDGSGAVDDGERLGITVNGPVPRPQPVLGDLAPPFHCSTDPPNTLRIPNSRSVRTPPIRWDGWIVEAMNDILKITCLGFEVVLCRKEIRYREVLGEIIEDRRHFG
jgi:hypothetical protein